MEINMSEPINLDRRRFFATAAMSIAAAPFIKSSSAYAQTGTTKPADAVAIKPGRNASFGPLKQIDADVLDVGYAEAAPPMVPRSFCCTAGPMTYTPSSMSHLCWRRRGTG